MSNWEIARRSLLSLALLGVLAGCGGQGAAEPTAAPADDVAAGEATTEPMAMETPEPPAEEMATPEVAVAPEEPEMAAAAKLNLNTATEEEFLTVPNVGSNMADEFEEYRPYASIVQFRREMTKYVSEEQVAEYENYVYVPVDINEADADTLQQLPGVDGAIAEDLMAGRPYASTEDFLARLGTHVSPEDAASAEAYLATP
jgi:DNA uptake protein ComE-like DNA-binding protein